MILQQKVYAHGGSVCPLSRLRKGPPKQFFQVKFRSIHYPIYFHHIHPFLHEINTKIYLIVMIIKIITVNLTNLLFRKLFKVNNLKSNCHLIDFNSLIKQIDLISNYYVIYSNLSIKMIKNLIILLYCNIYIYITIQRYFTIRIIKMIS